jgi:hypothetical protein
MNLANFEAADYRSIQQVRIGERLSCALLAHAFWANDVLVIPIVHCLGALAPGLFADRPLDSATVERPMTPAKAQILARRWQEGLSLWHPDDRDFGDREGQRAAEGKNSLVDRVDLQHVLETHAGLVDLA